MAPVVSSSPSASLRLCVSISWSSSAGAGFVGLLDVGEGAGHAVGGGMLFVTGEPAAGDEVGVVRAVLDLFVHEEDEDGEEQRVDEGEHDERREHGLRADHAREAHGRAQQAVDDPGWRPTSADHQPN